MLKTTSVLVGALGFVAFIYVAAPRGAKPTGASLSSGSGITPGLGATRETAKTTSRPPSTSIGASPAVSEKLDPREGLGISPEETQNVLSHLATTTARCVAALDSPSDPEMYMLDHRTLAKTILARDRLLRSHYRICSDLDQLAINETKDVTFLAFPAGRRHVLFEIRRDDADAAGVFQVIDQCASFQQHEWAEAADMFNAKPETERDQAIAEHKEAMEHIQKIHDEVKAAAKTGGGIQNELAARQPALASYHLKLLPPYLVVPKVGNRVWARLCIGR